MLTVLGYLMVRVIGDMGLSTLGLEGERGAFISLAIDGSAYDLASISESYEARGDLGGAIVLLRAASSMSSTPVYTVQLASRLAAAKRCEEARKVLAEADERWREMLKKDARIPNSAWVGWVTDKLEDARESVRLCEHSE